MLATPPAHTLGQRRFTMPSCSLNKRRTLSLNQPCLHCIASRTSCSSSSHQFYNKSLFCPPIISGYDVPRRRTWSKGDGTGRHRIPVTSAARKQSGTLEHASANEWTLLPPCLISDAFGNCGRGRILSHRELSFWPATSVFDLCDCVAHTLAGASRFVHH